ncbi:MAG: cytochrome C oxidase subunit II [Acidobacteriota bacterium]|nr:cytochrome C oxidase subunit II [Acidobacteriota bacterium]
MALPLLLGILAAITGFLFFNPPAWFPHPISLAGTQYDQQFQFTLWATGFIFFAAQLLLAFLIWRFRQTRRNPGPPLHTHGSRPVELLWTAAAAALFAGLALSGTRIWAGVHFPPPPRNAEIIEVYAHQFAWSFRYPGPDGKFGRTDIHLIDDAGQNPFGLDERDPAAQDDILSSSLKVPAGKEVSLVLHARDVIHDFFVRELRLKQDIVPGMEISYRFRAEKLGTYEIACSELCGLGHSQMRATMEVMPQGEFDRWKLTHARK